MNVFYLDSNPIIAARSMTNRHVVKMILESAQMLSTTHRLLDGVFELSFKSNNKGGFKSIGYWKMQDAHLESELYKVAHLNHPSTIWVRESYDHYMWLYNHMMELGAEYTRRYGKVHASIAKLGDILANAPRKIPHKGFKPAPCAMPDQYKTGDSIQSYHNYYRAEKLKYDFDIERFNKFYSK